MRDVYEIRRNNLRLLLEQWGGPKPLSMKLSYRKASFLVQMAGPHPTREVTEKTARRIEKVLELPIDWMDKEVQTNGQPAVNNTFVHNVIRVVAQEAEDRGIKLSPVKLSDIVLLVLEDSGSSGTIRPEYIKQLLQLMT